MPDLPFPVDFVPALKALVEGWAGSTATERAAFQTWIIRNRAFAQVGINSAGAE